MRVWIVVVGLLGLMACASAQAGPVELSEPALRQRQNAFDQPEWIAQGIFTVTGDEAVSEVLLDATVFDGDGAEIGFGYGALVDACGLALPSESVFQPGEQVRYGLTLELDDEDLRPSSLDITPVYTALAAQPANPFLTYPQVEEVTRGDIARLEFLPDGTVRFATGCDSDFLGNLSWFEYTRDTTVITPVPAPNADGLTSDVVRRFDLHEGNDLIHSRFSTHPDDRRVVFQDDINTLITGEADGSFQRLLWDDLSRFSLQGFLWMPRGRFMAYYYGAYGDPVRYITASVASQRISAAAQDVVPSVIVPGPTADGARVVMAREIDGVMTYILQSTTNRNFSPLFEGDAPGNNYPPPVYQSAAPGQAYIYVVRDVEGQAFLQCYDTTASELFTLAVLPLQLDTDERGYMVISPDAATLMIGSDGRHGGLWRIDLFQFENCSPTFES
jgi:hypothetical protein